MAEQSWRDGLKKTILEMGSPLSPSKQIEFNDKVDARIAAIERSKTELIEADKTRMVLSTVPAYRQKAETVEQRDQLVGTELAVAAGGVGVGVATAIGVALGDVFGAGIAIAAAPIAIPAGLVLAGAGVGLAAWAVGTSLYNHIQRSDLLSAAKQDKVALAEQDPKAQAHWAAGTTQAYELKKTFYDEAQAANHDAHASSSTSSLLGTYGAYKVATGRHLGDTVTGLSSLLASATVDVPAHRKAKARYNEIPIALRERPEPPL